MKWYVYFTDYRGVYRCHCFEEDDRTEQQARHFAKLVNGEAVYCR